MSKPRCWENENDWENEMKAKWERLGKREMNDWDVWTTEHQTRWREHDWDEEKPLFRNEMKGNPYV